MGRKKYNTEEERITAKKEYQRQWREAHPEYFKQYYQEHKEEIAEYMKQYIKQYQKQYNKTPMGRACYLLNGYQREDKKYNRGECTLTAQWIVENIFTQKCAHCEKTGWDIIGCNRLDNALPHTPDNVEPCCDICNKKVSAGRPKKALRAKETVL